MGQVRHGSATTTYAVRAAIQRSQASLAQLSEACDQSKDSREVAKARDGRGLEDWSEGAAFNRSH